MAVTAQLVAQTPLHLRYLLTQDGAAGTTLTIAAATILADCIAGALREMPGIGSDIAGLTTALARQRMLGTSAPAGATNLTEIPHATCKITGRSLSAVTDFAVDADTDAVNPLRCELNIIGGAAAAEAILEVEFQHTVTK